KKAVKKPAEAGCVGWWSVLSLVRLGGDSQERLSNAFKNCRPTRIRLPFEAVRDDSIAVNAAGAVEVDAMFDSAEVVIDDDDRSTQFGQGDRVVRRSTILALKRLSRPGGGHLCALASSFSVGHTLHASNIQELDAAKPALFSRFRQIGGGACQ